MKKYFPIFLAVVAAVSLVAVMAVRAQETDVDANANANVPADHMSANENENANSNTNVPEQDTGDGDETPVPTLVAHPPANSPANGQTSSDPGLVRIPHPDYIKYFTKIKRVGDALYGVMTRAAANVRALANLHPDGSDDAAADDSSSGSSSGSTEASNLEKILRPDLIKYYNQIKKIGASLYGIRIPGTREQSSSHPVVTAEQSACVVSAIEAKDRAVMDAVTAHAEAFNVAIAARTACQTAALGSTDGQREALASCVKSFNKSSAQAQSDLAKTRTEAWRVYVSALKSCGPATTDEGESAEILVEDGGDAVQ